MGMISYHYSFRVQIKVEWKFKNINSSKEKGKDYPSEEAISSSFHLNCENN